MNQVSLSDSVYLHFGTSSASTGAATNADSTPSVVVAEDGTDMGYAPTVTNVATGLYKVQIDATSGNGFEAGRRYSVYAVATVGGITGRDGIGEFEVLATDLNTGVASVTAAVTVGAMQADVVTASAIAAGAIGSSEAPLLANLDATVSSRLASASYTAPLDAAGTRAAIGLAAANLDTQLSSLSTAIGTRAAPGDAMDLVAGAVDAAAIATDAIDADALAASAITELVDAVWAKALESGFTADRLVRIIAAAVAGKVSGGPGSPVFRNLGDTGDMITGTADSNGNRTAAAYGA